MGGGSTTCMVLLTLPSRSSPKLRGVLKMTSLGCSSALVSGIGMMKSIVIYLGKIIVTDEFDPLVFAVLSAWDTLTMQ